METHNLSKQWMASISAITTTTRWFFQSCATSYTTTKYSINSTWSRKHSFATTTSTLDISNSFRKENINHSYYIMIYTIVYRLNRNKQQYHLSGDKLQQIDKAQRVSASTWSWKHSIVTSNNLHTAIVINVCHEGMETFFWSFILPILGRQYWNFSALMDIRIL